MFWPAKKHDAAETASLMIQLESAKRRITELMLENIQLAHEIQTLHEYRSPVPARPALVKGAEVVTLPVAANSEAGLRLAS